MMLIVCAGVDVGKGFTFIEIVPHAEYEVWFHGVCNCCHEGCNCRLVLRSITTPITNLRYALLTSDAGFATGMSWTIVYVQERLLSAPS